MSEYDLNAVANSFGKHMVLVNGWNFAPADYTSAWNQGRLLTAQIELSNVCDLFCEYCFRAELATVSKKRLPGEITIEKTLEVIDAVTALGARAINIIGAGEPTLDPALPDVMRYIARKNAIPIVSTNGARLSEKLVQEMHASNASVIIKANSFNPAIQDALVNRNGYTRQRDKGLALLIEAGFTDPTAQYQTRLGINSVVCQENKNEIPLLHAYCREHNIMPLMATFIPAGRTKNKTASEVPMQEFIALAKHIRDIDQNHYGIVYRQLMPYLGGVPCTQCSKASMYITITGDLYECPGQEQHIGNITNISVAAAFEKIKTIIGNEQWSCPPRVHYTAKR